MAKFDVNGAQNVEVSQKFPCEKTPEEQLRIMEEYTRVHREHLQSGREEREIACLQVLYPRLFRSIEDCDWIAGRIDFLPIGFGCVTSLGAWGTTACLTSCFSSGRRFPPRTGLVWTPYTTTGWTTT